MQDSDCAEFVSSGSQWGFLFVGLFQAHRTQYTPLEPSYHSHYNPSLNEISGESGRVCTSINNQLILTFSPDEQIINLWQFKDMRSSLQIGLSVCLPGNFFTFFPLSLSSCLHQTLLSQQVSRNSVGHRLMFSNIPMSPSEHSHSCGCFSFIFKEKKLLQQLRTPKGVFIFNYFFFIYLIHLIPKICVVPV